MVVVVGVVNVVVQEVLVGFRMPGQELKFLFDFHSSISVGIGKCIVVSVAVVV